MPQRLAAAAAVTVAASARGAGGGTGGRQQRGAARVEHGRGGPPSRLPEAAAPIAWCGSRPELPSPRSRSNRRVGWRRHSTLLTSYVSLTPLTGYASPQQAKTCESSIPAAAATVEPLHPPAAPSREPLAESSCCPLPPSFSPPTSDGHRHAPPPTMRAMPWRRPRPLTWDRSQHHAPYAAAVGHQ